MSRKPPKKQAVNAALGAMRESGKLLVFLHDLDLISMINIRGAQLADLTDDVDLLGDDPTVVLDQRIYEMLASMAR